MVGKGKKERRERGKDKEEMFVKFLLSELNCTHHSACMASQYHTCDCISIATYNPLLHSLFFSQDAEAAAHQEEVSNKHPSPIPSDIPNELIDLFNNICFCPKCRVGHGGYFIPSPLIPLTPSPLTPLTPLPPHPPLPFILILSLLVL